ELVARRRRDTRLLLHERNTATVRQQYGRTHSRRRTEPDLDRLTSPHRQRARRERARDAADGRSVPGHIDGSLERSRLAVLRRIQAVYAIRRDRDKREEAAVRCDVHRVAVDGELRATGAGRAEDEVGVTRDRSLFGRI